ADKPFSWAVWVKPMGNGAILAKMDEGKKLRGSDLLLGDTGNIEFHIISSWPGNAIKIETARPLPRGAWSHLVATYDGSSRAGGMKIFVNGEKEDVTIKANTLRSSSAARQPFRI